MITKIGKGSEIRFKTYDQNQLIELPVLLPDLVKDNHQVHLINKLVDGLSDELLSEGYSAKGYPAYSPKMLLKVWIYAYCQGVYTSRQLAKKLREDLCFIWLSGNSRPCFKTLASFRSVRMQTTLQPVLEEILFYLIKNEYVDLSDLYVDGSKWEANNNKHKIVWSKNTSRYKAAVLERVRKIVEQGLALQAEEDKQYKGKDLAELGDSTSINVVLNSESVSSCIRQMESLVEQMQDAKRQKKLEGLCKNLKKEEEKLAKYEHQETVSAGRNSYGKTDTDATGMRMKDEQTKPGYNTQIATSNQYIVHASVHQNCSDSPTLIPHVKGFLFNLSKTEQTLPVPEIRNMTADAGYGSEENYAYLESENFTAYVKYPNWYREQTGDLAKQIYRSENWTYDAQNDYYICPEGRQLPFVQQASQTTQNGYTQNYRVYECRSCEGCPAFKACRGEQAQEGTNRTVRRNESLLHYQDKARELLASVQGQEKRRQRGVDVETPFANIKHNMHHRRFLLRGLKKVSVEFNLLAVAHNLSKIACQETGEWRPYYAQRAAKARKKAALKTKK